MAAVLPKDPRRDSASQENCRDPVINAALPYPDLAVMDVFDNGMHIAILNASATTHMPDVPKMPYRPPVLNAGLPDEKPYTYRLSGLSCVAGDVIGDYSFDHLLEPGNRLVFGDMTIYSMVKTTTFNGINLPSIYIYNSVKEEIRLVRHFGYDHFKCRLS